MHMIMDRRDEEVKFDRNEDRLPFLRQLFVVSAAWLGHFLCGLSMGIPTMMIPQLRKAANSTDAVSEEMASWLYSVFGYSALPWVVIICISTRLFGRRTPYALVCLSIFSYNALLYFSVNVYQILIGELMQGIIQASIPSLSMIIVTEYISPKHRGLFSSIKSANLFWGIWASNVIGTFCDWKYIPLTGMCLSTYMITVLFWPESPQWLASRGRFDECMIAHRWLRGTDEEAEKELECLIKSQAVLMAPRKKMTDNYFISTVKAVSEKAFFKPLFLTLVLMIQYQFSGKTVCMMYAIDIIKKITTSESTAYAGMLILDAVTITGMYTGCLLSKFLKRRTLLFGACFIGISLLFVISLYLYLTDLGIVAENKIVTILLLTLFSVSISCGPLILSSTISGELIPLRYKSSMTMIYSLCALTFTSTLLKTFPYIYKTFHMSGAFLFFAVMSMFGCLVSYRYLPETKDRTLQEIEDILIGKKPIEEGTELLSY